MLSKRGREWVGGKERKYTLHMHHFLLRNEFMIKRNIPMKDFYPESPKNIKVNGEKVIPDAFYKHNNQWHFLEVDRTQKMIENKNKIELYRVYRDSGKFPKSYGHYPTIIYVTQSEYRRKELRGLLNGMKSEVILETELM